MYKSIKILYFHIIDSFMLTSMYIFLHEYYHLPATCIRVTHRVCRKSNCNFGMNKIWG